MHFNIEDERKIAFSTHLCFVFKKGKKRNEMQKKKKCSK